MMGTTPYIVAYSEGLIGIAEWQGRIDTALDEC